MPEAVIVAVARSPIGRAFKGSLKDVRPDDLTVQIVQSLLAQVPELDPTQIDDLILGCGSPAGRGRQQPGAGRRGARRDGPPPGHHRQPLLLVEPADHPHGLPRDQGG